MRTKLMGVFTAFMALNMLNFGRPAMLLAAATTPTPQATLTLWVTPQQAEPGQPITIRVENLPADVVTGRAAACVELHDPNGQTADSWPLEPGKAAAGGEFSLGRHLQPGQYQLVVTICAWFGDNPMTPEPLAILPFTVMTRSGLFDEIESHLSPNGQWTATLNRTTGNLELSGRRQSYQIFPEGSGARDINWSPDSARLLVVQPYAATDPQQGTSVPHPIEIWQVRLTERAVISTTRLFQSSPEAFEQDGVQQVVFGPWSPNSRYVVIWVGLLSASILADGLPPQLLDTETGQLYPIALDSSMQDPVHAPTGDNTALINPRYQSWSPDSRRLAITAGGYRSAQVNKRLNLFDLTTGQVTTVISQGEQIPGAVAWSPQGDVIAYAAVPAAQTGPEWADWMSFDNPAIAGRRIYLLDPATGQYHRLNNRESYQDAPVWSPDGARLYYVQRNGTFLDLMVANPATGQARAVPGARQPVHLGDPMRPEVGYYGQFGREELLAKIPESPLGATVTGRVVAGYGQHSPVSDLPLGMRIK